jgi:glycosyltransferase involved in cell wall biosynthesis
VSICIAFDHQIFGWQEYGGISRYIYELARELATKHEQNVNVISPLFINQYLKQAPDELRVWGVPMGRIPKTGRLVRAVNSLFVRPLMQWLAPDIVHETYYAKVRLAPKRAKVVLTVYDMIHERFPDSFSVADPTHNEKLAAVTRADHVICISRQTQQDLVDLMGVDPSKTSVVYLGFQLTTAQTQSCDAALGRPYLLYVGNRGGYKNFEGLLRSVAASPELKNRYRIVCFGGGALTNKEKSLIHDLGFADGDVRQVSGSDGVLAGLYQRAKAFVYPSLYEGFGIPPLEAMSFDCPVVCSGVSSIPEVVGEAGVYFDPANVDDMSRAIEQVVSDESLCQRLVMAGRERLKVFSWERCATETLEVYRKVLECEH